MKRYTLPAIDIVRAALKRGVLVREGRQWRYDRRFFNNATVKVLIKAGEAVREGDIVRARPT